MNNSLKKVLFALALCACFYGGMKWQQFLYLDICLDMGGGMNPGGYPICVIEKYLEKQDSIKQTILKNGN